MPTGAYYGADGKAKAIKNIYAGVLTDIPIYVERDYPYNYANLTKFFSMTNTGGGGIM